MLQPYRPHRSCRRLTDSPAVLKERLPVVNLSSRWVVCSVLWTGWPHASSHLHSCAPCLCQLLGGRSILFRKRPGFYKKKELPASSAQGLGVGNLWPFRYYWIITSISSTHGPHCLELTERATRPGQLKDPYICYIPHFKSLLKITFKQSGQKHIIWNFDSIEFKGNKLHRKAKIIWLE